MKNARPWRAWPGHRGEAMLRGRQRDDDGAAAGRRAVAAAAGTSGVGWRDRLLRKLLPIHRHRHPELDDIRPEVERRRDVQTRPLVAHDLPLGTEDQPARLEQNERRFRLGGLFEVDLDSVRRCAAVRDAAVVRPAPGAQVTIEGKGQGPAAVAPVAPRPDVAGTG